MNSQVRYNGTIYDVLKNFSFDKYQYSLIGTGDRNFIDIIFVEKVIENEKIRYIVSSNIVGDSKQYSKILINSLLDYIVNDIKDCINQEILLTKEDTRLYIEKCFDTLENEDIKVLVNNCDDILDDNMLDERLKRVIALYDSNMNKTFNKVEFNNIEEPEKTVDDIYSELEKTQNFGISIIRDYKALMEKNNGDYISEPVNHIFDKKEKELEKEDVVQEEYDDTNTFESDNQEDIEIALSNTNASKLTIDDIKFMLEKKSDTMTLQQRLYWENELNRLNSVPDKIEEQMNVGNPNKTYVLSNNKSLFKENAAYVSIYFLIALIGSFELLLTVIMFAKYL